MHAHSIDSIDMASFFCTRMGNIIIPNKSKGMYILIGENRKINSDYWPCHEGRVDDFSWIVGNFCVN